MGTNNPNQSIPLANYPPLPGASGTNTSQPTAPVSSAASSATPAPATYMNMFSSSAVRSSSSDVNVSHFTRAYREKAKDKEHLT